MILADRNRAVLWWHVWLTAHDVLTAQAEHERARSEAYAAEEAERAERRALRQARRQRASNYDYGYPRYPSPPRPPVIAPGTERYLVRATTRSGRQVRWRVYVNPD